MNENINIMSLLRSFVMCNLIVFASLISTGVMEGDYVCATLQANGKINFEIIIDGEHFRFDAHIKAHIDGYNKDFYGNQVPLKNH